MIAYRTHQNLDCAAEWTCSITLLKTQYGFAREYLFLLYILIVFIDSLIVLQHAMSETQNVRLLLP